MGVHAQPSGRARQIADGYVRLVEKVVLEYQESRTNLVTFLATGTADHEYRAQDHFESCVQSLHRAMEYLEQLRRFGYKRSDGTPFIPKPRELQVLRDSTRTQVRDMRDAVEHLDKDILEGRLSETAKVGIHLGWEKASLGSLTLGYTDVARSEYATPRVCCSAKPRLPGLASRRRKMMAMTPNNPLAQKDICPCSLRSQGMASQPLR